MKLKKTEWETDQVYEDRWATRFSWPKLLCGIEGKITRVDAQSIVSLSWQNNVFSLGTFYSNAHMVNNISLNLLIETCI